MTAHFLREMDRLHRDILAMSATVEELLREALEGLRPGNGSDALELSSRDPEIDSWHLQIEEECLKILALYHPVAGDLRRVMVVMKIARALEKVADLAVRISKRTNIIAQSGRISMPAGVLELATHSLAMLNDSIGAFVEQDAFVARDVCRRDDTADEMNSRLIANVVTTMKQDPDLIEPGLELYRVVRHVERVADLACSIAEDVVYLVDGDIISHPEIPRSGDTVFRNGNPT